MKLASIFKLASLPATVLAVTFAFGGAAVPSLAAASPNDGVKCPSGYDSKFAGGALTCTKHIVADVSNTSGQQCDRDAPFTNFQRMGLGQRDICLNQDVNIPSNSSLEGLANGRVVIKLPIGVKLGGRLGSRPVQTIGNTQIVEINPNADFIFYDQSKTLQRDVAIANAKALSKERTVLSASQNEVELGGSTVKTTPDQNGTLDKIEANISLFAFAQR
jgi:hypothetical protein